MSLATLMVDDVTILHASTTTDRYGNSTLEWSSATSTTSKAWVAQRSATDLSDAGTGGSLGRTGELSDWIIYLPAGTPITSDDRVEWAGVTPTAVFEVVGLPNPAKTPRGPHHLEVGARLIAG